jgi:chemotaxis family two-component system response regulator Rcp1
VEDNAADVDLVREALEEHSVEGELVIVTDGEEAIAFIESVEAGRNSRPDLVLLDLNLPRKNGYEVLKVLQSSMQCGRAPVVILSSSDATQDREKATQLGAMYLRKPSRLADFLKLGATFKELLGPQV